MVRHRNGGLTFNLGETGLGRGCAGYLSWLAVRGQSWRTLDGSSKYLHYFCVWCEARGVTRAEEVTRPILERYQKHLYMHRKTSGEALTWRGQAQRVHAIQGCFRWLVREGLLLWNPASDLLLPRAEKRLPKAILTEKEVERVLLAIDVSTPEGLCERAMLELLYASGLRRSELVGLRLDDMDRDQSTVWVRQGKGKKDRVVPIGERASHWLQRYSAEGRPQLACAASERTLFLSSVGTGVRADGLTTRVRQLLNAAGVEKPGSCHLFRHTMATLMLEGGADVRFVQEMLGHASLESTQIYTHVSVKKLSEVHARTHPGAKLKKLSERDVAREVSERLDVCSTVEGQGAGLVLPQ
jgi:integrase/recombinase XerD